MKNGRTYLFQIDPTWQRCKHRKDIQFGQTLVAGARQALLGTRARATRAQVPLSSAKLVDYGILHSIGKIMGKGHLCGQFRKKLSFRSIIQNFLKTTKYMYFPAVFSTAFTIFLSELREKTCQKMQSYRLFG